MPSLAELRKQKLKEQEEMKKEPEVKIIPENKVISISDLKPPQPPKQPPKKEKLPILHETDDFFVELAQSTEFKRFIYKMLYGKVHRTTKQHGNLDEKVKVGLQIFQNPKFSNVVKELKDNFRNGFIKPSQMNK